MGDIVWLFITLGLYNTGLYFLRTYYAKRQHKEILRKIDEFDERLSKSLATLYNELTKPF